MATCRCDAWQCTIPGPCVAQARPRVARRGNHVHVHDTAPVRDYKAYAKAFVATQRPPKLFDGPLELIAYVYLVKPKSWPRKRKHADTKPDADNFGKTICDCLEGLVYVNDSRIVDLEIHKRLSPEPRVEITVTEVS